LGESARPFRRRLAARAGDGEILGKVSGEGLAESSFGDLFDMQAQPA
jgi:hypothetical protein